MSEKDITRDVLRMFTYGLFVAASVGPDGPRAATISWVTQASFEPRLISVALRKGTAICEAVQASRRFALHIAGSDQAEFARAFFKVNVSSPDEIAGYHFTLRETGVPVFDVACTWLECEVLEEANRTGDHAVFIATVLSSGVRGPNATPLALHDTTWHYGG
jgi:flavin reductase (DIM6/NTAB) family NADH-FMN oxidoreductase RutF